MSGTSGDLVALRCLRVARARSSPPASLVPGSPSGRPHSRENLGLDQPILIQYGTFLLNAVQGDFGHSITTRRPARDVLLERIPATLQLAAAGMLLGQGTENIIIAVALTVWARFARMIRGDTLSIRERD